MSNARGGRRFALVALLAAAGYAAVRVLSPAPQGGAGGGGASAPVGGLSARIIAAARQYAPTEYGTAQWTEIMGAPEWAPGKWSYFEDHYGTTCGVFAAFVLDKAGAPPDYINRRTDDGGRGFTPSMHIAYLERAGMALGTIRRDADLRPGNVYHATHQTPTPGEHVGIVLERRDLPDGSIELVTADGGQEDSQGRQCSRIVTRKLVGDELHRTDGVPSSPMRVTWRLDFGG